MKTNSILILAFLLISSIAIGQKYSTKTGSIKFTSETLLETITAFNHQVEATIDTETGDFIFNVLMKSFKFENALMQEHFNDNYVESDTYPNATFVGKVANYEEVDFQVGGTFDVVVEGKLTIHGVTKKVSEKGSLRISDGSILGVSVFNILLSDYKIKISQLAAMKLSNSIAITVELDLDYVNL